MKSFVLQVQIVMDRDVEPAEMIAALTEDIDAVCTEYGFFGFNDQVLSAKIETVRVGIPGLGLRDGVLDYRPGISGRKPWA